MAHVQEDLIIPHVYSGPEVCGLGADLQHYTFYDFIVNKARGKSGPLFNFDVHDDVRMVHDATKEKNEVSTGWTSYTKCSAENVVSRWQSSRKVMV